MNSTEKVIELLLADILSFHDYLEQFFVMSPGIHDHGLLESAVSVLEQRIKATDPRNILTRGYSLVTDADGVVLNSASAIRSGQRVRLLFADGHVDAEVL